MNWDDNIDGVAFEIAKTNNNPLRVMAGPGTGKSFAMMRRAARLLQEGVAPESILAVTFTRTAANGLIEDLSNLNIHGCKKINAGTLHSLCFQILNREDVFSYLSRFPRPLIASPKHGIPLFEAAPLIADLQNISKKFGGKNECKKRIYAFEASWARLQNHTPGWPADDLDRKFHANLIEWLKFHGGMLIGELIPLALNYLKNNPYSDELGKYKHIIVDEYQDLNKAEQTLLDLISGNNSISIVGDEDQSIYAFRFAHPEGIKEFNQTHPDTHDESLTECRRCPQKIVNVANSLIKNNHTETSTDRLCPRKDNAEGKINIIQWENLKEEISGLSNFIEHLIFSCGNKPEDILILTPRRLTGYGIRDNLKKKEIPVHSFYYEEALETAEAQKAFILFNLLVHPNDRVALRYWLGLESQTWNSSQYNKLRFFCETSGNSPSEVFNKVIDDEIALTGISKIIERYKLLKSQLLELKTLTINEFINSVFPEGQDWSTVIREACLLKLEEFQRLDDYDKNIKNDDIFNNLFNHLKTIITQPEMPTEGEFVRIMSLHKSKGLTNKIVIVSGCVEGLIPFVDLKSTSQVDQNHLIAEQRRLLYVAITRPTDTLILSSFKQIERASAHKLGVRIGRGGTKKLGNTISSRFLNELGDCAPIAIKGQDWIKSKFI